MAQLDVTIQGNDQTRAAFASLNRSQEKSRKSAETLLNVWRDLTVVITGA